MRNNIIKLIHKLHNVLQIILVNNSSKISKTSCFVYTKPHVKGNQRKPQVKGNQNIIQLLIEWNSLAD